MFGFLKKKIKLNKNINLFVKDKKGVPRNYKGEIPSDWFWGMLNNQ